MLEFVEEALDEVALPVERVIDGALDLAVAAGRDVGPSAASFDQIDDSAGVVAAVSDEVAIRLEPVDQESAQWSCRRIGPATAQSAPAFPADRPPR